MVAARELLANREGRAQREPGLGAGLVEGWRIAGQVRAEYPVGAVVLPLSEYVAIAL